MKLAWSIALEPEHFDLVRTPNLWLLLVISQRAKKVVSDSPGLVDFAIGLVNSVFNLPDRQVIYFLGIQITEELYSILLINFFSG